MFHETLDTAYFNDTVQVISSLAATNIEIVEPTMTAAFNNLDYAYFQAKYEISQIQSEIREKEREEGKRLSQGGNLPE
jgi:hypothetical protein